jgi:thioredoxin 1
MKWRETLRKALGVATFAVAAALGFLALWTLGVDELTDRAFASSPMPVLKASRPLAGGEKVTFLELGSVGCRPCEAMKPVMQGVRDKYGKQVEVTFHDVKKDPSIARKWRVVLIPTQIFLDPAGQEAFRHEGFFALEDVEKVLRQLGVR